MGTHTDKEKKICDGRVVIYQRTDVRNTTWHCRIAFPKHPYIRQSLSTTNEKEAEKLATKLYEDMKSRFERGLPLRRKRFEEVMEAYFENLALEVENDIAKQKKLTDQRLMSKYPLEFFKGKYIDGITTSHVNEFREWRRRYWTTGPGSKLETYTYERGGKTVVSKTRPAKLPALSTQNSENVLLRSVFKFAAMSDWINQSQMPLITIKIPHAKKGRDAHRRPGLNKDEVNKLIVTCLNRINETIDERLLHQRRIMLYFTCLMVTTGMRTFECMKLRWKDIDITSKDNLNETYGKIYVSGKGKSRWLISLDGYAPYLMGYLSYITQLRKKQEPDFNVYTSLNDRMVFCDYDGKPIKSLSRGFTALLKEAGLHIDPETGKHRDAYCLRHYYATERLIAGVSVYTLAENMGTSVQMIERHYGHLKPEMAAQELTKPGKK